MVMPSEPNKATLTPSSLSLFLFDVVFFNLNHDHDHPEVKAFSNMPRILFVSGFHPNTRARDLAFEFERYVVTSAECFLISTNIISLANTGSDLSSAATSQLLETHMRPPIREFYPFFAVHYAFVAAERPQTTRPQRKSLLHRSTHEHAHTRLARFSRTIRFRPTPCDFSRSSISISRLRLPAPPNRTLNVRASRSQLRIRRIQKQP